MFFLIKLALVAALLFSGLLYFLQDTPFYRQLVSEQKAAGFADRPHLVFAERIKYALNEKQPTDFGALKMYYKEAAGQKYQGLVAGTDAAVGLTRSHYLRSKEQEFEQYFEKKYDRDKNGSVERAEWPKSEVFKLVVIDSNRDNVLTMEELWLDAEQESNAEFTEADQDNSGTLTEAEYMAFFASDAAASKIAREVDANNNQAVNLDEVNRFLYISNNQWTP